MRTELARVQIEVQRQSFEQKGYEEYQFHALENACEICAVLGERHFTVKDMMPRENAAPMHPSCRYSVSVYIDREEFDKWMEERAKSSKAIEKSDWEGCCQSRLLVTNIEK